MDRVQTAFFAGIGLMVLGCGKDSHTPPGESRPALTVSIPSSPLNGADLKKEMDRLHQPFSEAVVEHCSGDQQLPPQRTIAGMSTTRVRLEVQRVWDTIRFVDQNGKHVFYIASVNTDFGYFRVLLKPEVAPNHVRNFVALAMTGYYNGLTFEQLFEQAGNDGPDSILEMIQAGCPLGTGEPGIAHLGYWLRPEVDESSLHQPGTLGAFREDDPDSAACRFYVTLTKAPAMDGQYTVFGTVVEGLDVVRTISKLPRVAGTYQPEKPAVIRTITIETQEAK